MGSPRLTFLLALFLLVCLVGFGQSSALNLTNFQVVSQTGTAASSTVTYRADLVNPGPALPGVAAVISSLDPFSVRVMPGQDTLQFAPVPASGRVTSSNTFTILVTGNKLFDSSKLQVSYQSMGGVPVANPGANQTSSVGSTVTLNGGGSTNPSGAGTLSYTWAFASVPTGSTAYIAHASNVIATFVVDTPGKYVIALTVSNGVAGTSANVTVSTAQTAPVANAGPNQTVNLGVTAVLNGSASTSVDGRALSYAWTLASKPAGSTAVLSGANTVAPTFVVDKAGSYTAQLSVNDGMASTPSTVTVATRTTAPVASAGPNQSVNPGSLVQLDGSGSTDANGLPITFLWSLLTSPAGSGAALGNATSVNPTFVADVSGIYVAQLIVNNGSLSSSPATVTITTHTAIAPTANAGTNQTVTTGNTVTLNGSGSDIKNLPLTYQWTLISKPAGSSAVLSNATLAKPSFVADVPGSYVAQLIVNNGVQSSAPATVTISTGCAQPQANAGANQSVGLGAKVVLDGSGSGDVCRDALTYSWTFTTLPTGSASTLTGASTVAPSFVPDVAGTYVAQLIVNNGVTNSNPATVTVTAASAPANAAILLPSSVPVAPGQVVPFNVALATGAPAGGVFVMLSSSDISVLTIAPASIYIGQGSLVPNRAPTVTGVNSGSATITASAYGLPSATQAVQVTSNATMSFSPATVTINGLTSQTLTLTLSGATLSGGVVSLTSSNPGVATVPASIAYPANTGSVSVAVTGVAAGSATITASTPNFASASAGVTVSLAPAGIVMPSNVSVAPGETVTFPVTMGSAAGSGGVFITLASSDTSKLIIAPATIFIAQGSTAPSRAPTVTGVSGGSATITATAFGLTSASELVQVSSGSTITLSPPSLTISGLATQNLSVILSSPAPSAGLTLSLSSSNPGVATVPASVSIGAFGSGATIPVTSVSAGSATITVTGLNYSAASAGVTVSSVVTQGIVLPANLTLAAGQTSSIPVTLASPAPSGGLYITLSSSDGSVATIAPSTILIPQGATVASRAVTLTGVNLGSALISASAYGFPTTSQMVQVSSGGVAGMSFSPTTVSITGTATQTLSLVLSSPAPSSGMSVNLTSSSPGVASVPATVSFGPNATLASVPVTGVTPGSATISASAPNFGNATSSIMVLSPAAITMPASSTVMVGQSMTLPVTLPSVAPAGGVNVALACSDKSKATVTASVFVPGGSTAPTTTAMINGLAAGTVNISAVASGYSASSALIQVLSSTAGTSFMVPSTVTVSAGSTQNLTLNLSGPAPAGLTASLSTTNASVASVPQTVTFGTGSTAAIVTVTGVATGSVTISANVSGFGNASASVTVSAAQLPAIVVPATITVGPGQSAALPVALTTAAPPQGVYISLASTDPSKATVTPTVFIGAGSITPSVQPQINGIGAGSVTINATAPDYQAGRAQVSVVASSGGSSYFSPATMTVYGTATQSMIMFLSSSLPTGATVHLTSSDPRIATVPAVIDIIPAYSSVIIPVTGVSAGTITITATTPGFGDATALVTVSTLQNLSIQWHGGCWQPATIYGTTGNFQAVDYALSSPTPVPLQGSLFYAANCDTSAGVDNMNDYGALTSSGHSVQGFSHHPDLIPSSAVFWIGPRTVDGQCAPGAPCSGCYNYNASTPLCSSLP